MLSYPEFDPVAVTLEIRWYGLMYLAAFAAAYWLARLRAARTDAPVGEAQVGDLIFYGAVGVIAGGRLGYVLFYGLSDWADDWLFPLKIWDGGMSFHGGLLGVLAAMWWYGRELGRTFFEMTDFIAAMKS
ncbi:MAG: prolipoprotein diacylglyceryl transferase family protein, partial [Pseudomonadota bacterium]